MNREVEASRAESVRGSGVGLREFAVAGAAGVAGTAVMAPVLAAARALGALDPAAFAALATVGGLTPSVVTGVLLFVAGGATVLPLPYVTLSTLLPGRSLAEKGAGFAAATWAGFVVAFYVAQAGVALWTFLVLTLAAHLAYGCVVGGVYDRLAHRSSGRCSGGP